MEVIGAAPSGHCLRHAQLVSRLWLLRALLVQHEGGPVGLSTLAVAVGEESTTLEEVCEPFLVRAGLLARTPRGRIATAAAWDHLGLTRSDNAAGQPMLPVEVDRGPGARG